MLHNKIKNKYFSNFNQQRHETLKNVLIVLEISQQFLNDNEIQHEKVCHTLAINQNNSLLLTSADEQIKIFLLKSGKLKQIQIHSLAKRPLLHLIFYLINRQLFLEDKSIIISSSNLLFNLFPIQYNEQKQLIINKNGNFINVIKFNKNYDDEYLIPEITLEQTIDFIHWELYGTLSPDGQYLATWDKISKQIQIRKYQQQ